MLIVAMNLVATVAFSQSVIKVTGKVTDSKGETLPGVGVKVKGTSLGATTSVDGKFTLNIPDAKSVLVFTYIGFITKEEAVAGRTTINVQLKEAISSLDEVVVTGYGGTVRKRDLTSATSTVSAKDIAERQPVNLFDALQGRAAGVLVMNDSGEPGAEGTVQVRGPASLSEGGTQPLYVVDGVITENGSSINPNDIQSIEVLKDAASASIYGARAAAGVILITTKRGQDGKPRFDVQYAHQIGQMAHKIQQANSADLRYYRILQNRTSAGLSTDSLNPSYNSDNDLQDLLLGNTSRRNDVKVAVSGGQKGLTYYSSLNYLDDQGIALNSWSKSVQGRINVDYQATPKFKFTSSISYAWKKGNGTDINGSVRPVFDRPNNLRIYLPDGSLTSYLNSKRNPVANALLLKDETTTWTGQFNNTLNYDIIKGLKYTLVANASLKNEEDVFFQPRFLDDNGDENDGTNSLSKRFNWELQSYFNYNKTIARNHSISATLGVSADRSNSNRYIFDGLKKSFVNEEIYVINGSNIDLTGSRTTASTNSTASLFGRLNYNYKSKYLFSWVYRRDGSSRFGPNQKWGDFISGSAAWRFSDEKLMAWSKSFLSDGKLRFSYGSLGNDRIGDFEFLDLIIFGTGSYNGVGAAYLDSKKGNTDIHWENTISKNLGTDLSFFRDRLTLTAEVYDKTTAGLLANREIPKETGFTQQRVNFGTIQNRGVEFVLGATALSSKRFTWNVSGNITFERGTIKKLFGGQEVITDDDRHLLKVGGQIGDFLGWKNLGVYRWDASNAYAEDGTRLEPVNVAADGKTAEYYTYNGQVYTGTRRKMSGPAGDLIGGDVIWQDLNNDGIIDDSDRHVIGNAQPDCYLGLVNNFRYKQFNLSFIINSTIGGQVYNDFKVTLTNNSSSNGPALPEAIYGSWKKQGDIAEYPNFVELRARGNEKRNGNSKFLEDASFLRLSSARLTYNVPTSLTKKAFMKSASVFMYGTNILTWTNYTGYDPEFSSSVLTMGVDGGRYPKVKQFGLGVNISL